MHIPDILSRAPAVALLGALAIVATAAPVTSGARTAGASGAAERGAVLRGAVLRGAVLQDGSTVEFCDEGTNCRSIRHPLAAGDVRQIVTGDFVKAAQASWIALGERAVSLCYLGAELAVITCTPIANGSEAMKGMQIAYVDLDDGARSLRLSARSGEAGADAAYGPYPFMAALSAAADVLQKHATRQHGSASPGDNAFAGVGDVCSFVDGGNFTCTGAAAKVVQAERRRGVKPPVAPDDAQSISTVYTGSGHAGSDDSPTVQVCRADAAARMKNCDSLRNRPRAGAHRSCVANVDASLRECLANVDDAAQTDSGSAR